MRDHDEWRRPWPAGAVWLPAASNASAPSPASTGAGMPEGGSGGAAQGSGTPDLVADAPGLAYATSVSAAGSTHLGTVTA